MNLDHAAIQKLLAELHDARAQASAVRPMSAAQARELASWLERTPDAIVAPASLRAAVLTLAPSAGRS